MRLARIVLHFAFVAIGSVAWAGAINRTIVQSTRTWAGLAWSGMEALSRLVSALSEPERLIVVGLSLITISLIVRRRASRRGV